MDVSPQGSTKPLHLWLLIAASTLCFVALKLILGPEYLYSGDPAYLYLYNGFNPLFGLPYFSIDHPGTPLLALSTLVLWLTKVTPEALYGQTETYLNCLFGGVVVLRALSLWFIGRRLRPRAFLFVALYPVLLGMNFSFAHAYCPDLFAHLLSPWLCYLLLKDESSFGRGSAVAMGLLLGTAVMLKLPYGFCIPFALLWRPKHWRCTLAATLAAAAVWSIPLWPARHLYFEYLATWVMQLHGYMPRTHADAFWAGVGAVGTATVTAALLLLLVLTRVTRDRTWWLCAAYWSTFLFISLRWGEPRYAALFCILMPVAYHALFVRLSRCQHVEVAIALIFVVGTLHMSIGVHRPKTFSHSMPIVEGYQSRSRDYAMMFGYAGAGNWLPRPPTTLGMTFINVRDDIPTSLSYPTDYYVDGAFGVAHSRAELAAKLPDLRYLSVSPDYRAWFHKLVVEQRRLGRVP